MFFRQTTFSYLENWLRLDSIETDTFIRNTYCISFFISIKSVYVSFHSSGLMLNFLNVLLHSFEHSARSGVHFFNEFSFGTQHKAKVVFVIFDALAANSLILSVSRRSFLFISKLRTSFPRNYWYVQEMLVFVFHRNEISQCECSRISILVSMFWVGFVSIEIHHECKHLPDERVTTVQIPWIHWHWKIVQQRTVEKKFDCSDTVKSCAAIQTI